MANTIISPFTHIRSSKYSWLGVELLSLLGALAAVGCGGADYEGADQTAPESEAQITVCKPPLKVVCSPAGCGCLTPPQPAVENFTLTPDYYITNVVYAPPGKSSNINYSNSTSTGSTTSSTSGFKSDTKVTADASGGFFGNGNASISAGESYGTTSSDAVDVSETWSQGYKKTGQIDAINHNYDEIWFLIRPPIAVTYQPQGSVLPASVKWKFMPGNGSTTGIQAYVYAGWLTSAMQMPADVKQTLDQYGITSAKYATLLGADPLFTGFAPNQSMDAGRFDYVGEFPFEPPFMQSDTPSTQSYSVDQRTTNTSTAVNDWSYSVGFSASGGVNLGLFNAKLTLSDTWTWTNSTSVKESSGSGSTDSLTVGQPAFGYSGPNMLHVYEDKIYKTYAFTLDWPPPMPFYDTATQCTVGGTTMHCCPSGSVMVGARVDKDTLKCAWLRDASGMVSLDTGTQRNGMHACPFGSAMIGMRVDLNQLACKQIPGNSITAERVDSGTQDTFPMHVCESTVSTQAMSGIRVDRNLLNCATNANLQ